MKTKLVYVLTCAPDKYYIEQALMSVFSARYWNPDAHIVLITDDQTDKLLVGKRGEIIDFISERIVIPFANGENMMYRSRYLKTMVRELVKGDFLFIDCDTIVCKPLYDIDNWDIEVGAVLESHLLVSEFCDSLFQSAYEANIKIGVDLSKEKEYFSSGVLYVKDTPNTHKLYNLWHQYWIESESLGLLIDQPSLCKANISNGHIIKKIPDTYNTILFTRCRFTRDAHILHIASYRNPSYLFGKKTLEYVKGNGISNDWLLDSIIHPCNTFLPFDYDILYSTISERRNWVKGLSKGIKGYYEQIENNIDAIFPKSRINSLIIISLKYHVPTMAIIVWMLWKRWKVLSSPKLISDNICRKKAYTK